ncbi:tetratricopeptide repeat protein [Aliiruegeria lutimaris]|nr:hypothetical protein [Aliiruegeria lutimaris]
MEKATQELPDRHTVELGLKRALTSPEFEGAGRLREFLSYVVEETLEGRGNDIRGKRIAEDVYDLAGISTRDSTGVVRVDASRLRRRLDVYYAGTGSREPLRIYIDKGGYAPRFEAHRALEQTPNPEPRLRPEGEPRSKGVTLPYWVLLLLIAAAIGGGLLSLRPSHPPVEVEMPELPDLASIKEREVLFEQSTATLKARNAAAEARTMMFPATEPWRVRAAQVLYDGAITLDPSYFGGYAGGAQAAAMIAGVSPPGPERDAMLDKGRSLAAKAIELAPTEAWSQSALAFLKLVEREFDEANRLSLRAIELDPDDLQALEMDAIIALFSGDFERAAKNAAPEKHINRNGSRFPWRNALGNAHYHLGNYELSIRYLKEAAALGEPVSEINSSHLIAALQASGKTELAASMVQGFNDTWPESRVHLLLQQIFQDPADAKNVIAMMKAAGWSSASAGSGAASHE